MGPDTSKPPLQSVGNYDLLDKIAEGGMGGVFRGRQRDSGLVVAVKIMPAHMAQNPILLKRFEQEFRAASRLDHPNIVRALDFDNTGAKPLVPGAYAEVQWPVHREAPSLFVPPSAIATTTERTFVDRVKDGKVEQVTVGRGAPMGDLVEVFGELAAGDQVLKRGSEVMANGTAVTTK